MLLISSPACLVSVWRFSACTRAPSSAAFPSATAPSMVSSVAFVKVFRACSSCARSPGDKSLRPNSASICDWSSLLCLDNSSARAFRCATPLSDCRTRSSAPFMAASIASSVPVSMALAISSRFCSRVLCCSFVSQPFCAVKTSPMLSESSCACPAFLSISACRSRAFACASRSAESAD